MLMEIIYAYLAYFGCDTYSALKLVLISSLNLSAGTDLLSQAQDQLSSALAGLTAVFGMALLRSLLRSELRKGYKLSNQNGAFIENRPFRSSLRSKERRRRTGVAPPLKVPALKLREIRFVNLLFLKQIPHFASIFFNCQKYQDAFGPRQKKNAVKHSHN